MDDKVLKAINDLDRKLDQKFDQKFEDLSKKLDLQFEEKFINLFNQGFEELVKPEIEYLKEDLEKRFDRIDRVLDRLAAKQMEQEGELKNHSKRLKKVEVPARAA